MRNPSDPYTFLSQLQSKGIRLGLEPLAEVLRKCGNPHLHYPTVLIAGTNGKGSVAAILAAFLQAGGYTVGLYTSPHLVDFRERIQVNGEMISPCDLRWVLAEVRQKGGDELTYFECATAMAFMHFARSSVDIAVLEAGMGGRLDATNLARPACSIITNISREHCDYLGRTLADIAGEKGGIIKDGGVCITAARQPAVLAVIEAICHERRARLYRMGRDIKVRRRKNGHISYYGISMNIPSLPLPLPGGHQRGNTGLALAALEILAAGGIGVPLDAIAGGRMRVHWEGRFDMVRSVPPILLDGAHNPAAAAVLAGALREELTYEKLVLIFSVLRDKNYRAILKILAPLADRVIVTSISQERALPPERIEPVARRFANRVESISDPIQALARARALAGPGDLILVTGSLYLVGRMKEILSSEHASQR
ncbi:MAG: bifunctional folylpolyglutamate synthase/dihydrofolate synthase [Deltaproteobacteria bacterium]|nr:bifunctional folylpolyglutamate synthase/dihydrofolate synthase [Deltaproteobacteria bacterium]